jgi:hypothetical protein
MKFLETLSNPKEAIFNDIADIVIRYDEHKKFNFQSKLRDDNDLFSIYELGTKEDPRKFITIDPTIIQIMIFDDEDTTNDIVYSLKLIIREQGKLTIRYTTHLFPLNSKIDNTFKDLSNFNKFNKSLGNDFIDKNYDKQLLHFLKIYIKFYNFYKKCYSIEEICDDSKKSKHKRLIDYQLKYISILGKARFGRDEIKKRTAILSDYVMSNLIFASPTYAFISGGYKGFKTDKYGITRSGYEIAKKYNRPILTIMCKEGKHDSHEYSDAELIYGEHWGEDSIALSQLTDGAIIIAPFGGWTYIECLTLLANKKIIGIYNDLYNILNYEKERDLSDNEIKKLKKKERLFLHNLKDEEIEKLIKERIINKSENKNFFMFTSTEQNNIIDYYINYYLILMNLINNEIDQIIEKKNEFYSCLDYGIKLLMHLKTFLNKQKHDKPIDDYFILLINTFNELKTIINKHVNYKLIDINNIYFKNFCKDDYQKNIPEKCDGIWIKPIFNLIEKCITIKSTGGTGYKIDNQTILDNIEKYDINMEQLRKHPIFTNLNNNIIFVFSDAMYLNMYINNNLNTSSFQEKIHTKIKNLSSFTISESKYSIDLLSQKDINRYIDLNRNIDGMYNTDQGKIINDNLIREKYSFIINVSCNNYTSILEDQEPNPMLKDVKRRWNTLGDLEKLKQTGEDIKKLGKTEKVVRRHMTVWEDKKSNGKTSKDARIRRIAWGEN